MWRCVAGWDSPYSAGKVRTTHRANREVVSPIIGWCVRVDGDGAMVVIGVVNSPSFFFFFFFLLV